MKLTACYEADSDIARIDITTDGEGPLISNNVNSMQTEQDIEVVPVEELPMDQGVINLEFKLGQLVGIEIVGASKIAPAIIQAAAHGTIKHLSQTA